MKLTNKEMDIYAFALKNIFEKTEGKLAYVISKNYRILASDLQEYEDIKNDTIKKYGIEGKDGNYSININSDSFKDFLNDMKQYDNIQSEVNLVMLKPEDLYSSALNAQDILSISFMIDEEKDNGTE